jgi:hypothetical protein
MHVEDMTTSGGQPVFDEITRDYLRRARLADPAVIAPYRAALCPECDELPAGADGLVPCDGGTHAHVVIDHAVILGCEGFFVIDPAVIGMDRGSWEDWRLSHGS